MEMRVYDRDDRYIVFADVESVDEARGLWTQFAGLTAGSNLCRFMVVSDDALKYEGNYVTDEC